MNAIRNATFLAACLFAGGAWAQSTSKPLNLQLPPSDVPVTASTAPSRPANLQRPPAMPIAAGTAANHPAHPSATDQYGNPTSAPGVYYGDTSGRIYGPNQRVAAQRCDDSTYNQPQTHGSVSMGVMGGNHVSGNYQAGTFSVTKNLGDCEHPSGVIGFSIRVGQSRLHGRGW